MLCVERTVTNICQIKKKKNQGKKHLFHPRSGHENRKTNFSSASCGDIVGVMMQTNFTFLENKKRGINCCLHSGIIKASLISK